MHQPALLTHSHTCHPPSFASLHASLQRTTFSRVSRAAELSPTLTKRSSSRKKGAGRHLRSHVRKQQVPALRAQPVEVISQGEVADVEEIEGIRLLTDDDRKRPIVQYLIKWKVCTQSQPYLCPLLRNRSSQVHTRGLCIEACRLLLCRTGRRTHGRRCYQHGAIGTCSGYGQHGVFQPMIDPSHHVQGAGRKPGRQPEARLRDQVVDSLQRGEPH